MIVKDEKNMKENSLTNKFISPKRMPTDVSQMEKELSNSLKLLESGLSNLDIEAAHFFDTPKLRNSDSFKEKCVPNKLPSNYEDIKQIKFSHNTSILSSNEANDHLSKSSLKRKKSIPPDLTFSFYSSTEEASPKCHSIINNCFESSYSNVDLDSALNEMLITSANNVLSKENVLKSDNSIENVLRSDNSIENVLKSGNSKKNVLKSDNSKENVLKSVNSNENVSKSDKIEVNLNEFDNLKVESEINGNVIEIDELVESLMKIESALNDLDKEAAHILNPTGLEVSYLNLFTNEQSSLEDKTLCKNTQTGKLLKKS